MKKLNSTFLLLLFFLVGYGQYELSWIKQLPEVGQTNWVSHNHMTTNSLIYNLRWYDNLNDTSRLFNQLYQLSNEGDIIWDFDWSVDFIDYEFRFIPVNETQLFFVANSSGFNQMELFKVGLLELGNGIIWEESRMGSVSTGHLAKYSDMVNNNALVLLSNEDQKTILSSYSINGDLLWTKEFSNRNFFSAALLNDGLDQIWLLNAEKRFIYDANGSLVSEDQILSTPTPSYNSGYTINSEDEWHQIHWIGNHYLFIGLDEDLNLFKSDTFFKACPAFGDWQLFIEDDNNGNQYLGGIETCEDPSFYGSNIFRYSDRLLDWTYSTEGMITAMQLTEDKLFYLNGKEIGVLNNEDGTVHWITTTDSLNYFSDYTASLLVKEDAMEFYVFSKSTDSARRTYVSKYTEKSNNNIEANEDLFSIYPNPTSGKLYLNSNNIDVPLNYEIFDILGTSVMSGMIFRSELNVSQLEKGTYFMRIEGQDVIRILIL